MKSGVILISAVMLFTIGYLFYKSIVVALFFAIFSFYAIPLYNKHVIERRNRRMNEQFRHLMYSLSSLLAAGKSVENAFKLTELDLRILYASGNNVILPELERVNGKVSNGETIEKALFEFGERTGQGDIRNFAEVFTICKRSGGDLIEVARKTANLIAEKMEIEQEINVITAQKKFEAKAMAIVPFAIVGLLVFSSPEYMQPLYAGVGRLIMTAALLVFGLSYYWVSAITNIRM